MIAVLEGYFFKNLIDTKSLETTKNETTQNCTFFQNFLPTVLSKNPPLSIRQSVLSESLSKRA